VETNIRANFFILDNLGKTLQNYKKSRHKLQRVQKLLNNRKFNFGLGYHGFVAKFDRLFYDGVHIASIDLFGGGAITKEMVAPLLYVSPCIFPPKKMHQNNKKVFLKKTYLCRVKSTPL
jgi:hypothetical protein